MRNAVCQPIVRTLLEHAVEKRSWRTEAGRVLPAAYCDPAHLQRERAALFGSLPQVVALSSDLPQPGSHVTRDTFAVPLLLTRGEDGEVTAMANVCAHRGAQVVADGRGCRRALSCPYHAWTYDLEGRLVGLPDREAFPDVPVPGPGMRRLPVLEEHGLVWVAPTPVDDRADMAVRPELGPIADDLDALDVAGRRHWRSHRFELALNWKLVVDTFLEPYHFASLHRDTVAPLFMANLCVAERFGRHVREVLPRRSLAGLAAESPETWNIVPHSAIVYVLFPSTVLVMQLDHIELWRVTPDAVDPGRSICDLDFYVPGDDRSERAERHWENNWRITIDTVIEQDFPAMAGVQRGLGSGVIDAMLIGANEPALGAFHDVLAEVVPLGATEADTVPAPR